MLWRKKTLTRGQGGVLDFDDDGKSEITFACFCSLLTLHVPALEELLANIPMVCPLLEKPIAWTIEEREGKQYHPFSPSIDRKFNDKGYVKGNVWIVSHKANAMKNCGTAEEIAQIVRNLMKKTGSQL
jgi:hypothetical protein